MSDEENTHPSNKTALEGRYANHFDIGYNAFEFVIDFGQFYEGNAAASIHTRIITSPIYALELYERLGDLIREYESEFKTIEDFNEDS